MSTNSLEHRGDEIAPEGHQADGARVLVVARPAVAEELRGSIESAGLVPRGLRDPADAPLVAASWKPHVTLIDLELGSSEALALASKVKRQHPTGACVFVAASTNGEVVDLTARSEADALLLRPLDQGYLQRIVARSGPATPVRRRPTPLQLPTVVSGSSDEMREVWRLVTVSASSGSSVVITGETGVGKEVVARALHRFSPRRAGPFVAVNCGALPETLLESELFGHEKGSFTGAATQHKGRFELAHGGTLFLDEIGDLPLALQVKLLRVLQEHTFERVGGTESLTVDVRVVAATHRDLGAAVRAGKFRADLFYRLQVLCIHVPPLRERSGDLLRLWERFLFDGAARDGRAPPITSRAAQRILLEHDWPGNVRELQNVAQHALTVANTDAIRPVDLPGYLAKDVPRPSRRLGLAGLSFQEIERAAILETVESLGSVRAAAEMLGISVRKIHYRLREYREAGLLEPTTPARGHAALPSPATPTIRILLAEDDDELRWALTEFLRSEGYEVIAVADGKALLEHLGQALLLELRDDPPDVIVADIRMPGMDGMQLLEGVRNRGWNVPVVLISAYGDEETRRRAGALGATAFLDKPIDVATLQRVIHGAVAT